MKNAHPIPVLRRSSLAALLSFQATHAQTNQVWNSGGSDDLWNKTSLNWDAGAVWVDNNNAIFNGTGESLSVTVPVIINDLIFDTTDYTIASSGAGNFTLANDSASTITVTNAGTTATVSETLANSLSGPSTLTKNGAGTLVMAGTAANAFSGGTNISAGALTASHEGALGTGLVTNTATLNVNKANVTFTGLANAMSGNGLTNVTALGTGTNTVNLNGNYAAYTGNWNIGAGAAAGAGKVQMNGPDNAATTINLLPNSALLTVSSTHLAAIVLNGGDTGESLGQLRVETNGTWAGPVTLAGTMTGTNDGLIGANAGFGTISGVIGEIGGARELTKTGGGTNTLTGLNTYSGGTRVLQGLLAVSQLNNTGSAGNAGTGSVISLGNGMTGASLVYTGTGENTNRSINLSGTGGGPTMTQSGASGNFNLSGSLTATGVGAKTLTLNGSTAATGEISGTIGTIFDNGNGAATNASADFAAAVNNIQVDSIAGVLVGSNIAGTGISGGTRVTAISGSGPYTLNLSANTNGTGGTAGQAITFTPPPALVKNGTGTWKLSGNNSFSGNVTVNVGNLTITNSNALGLGPKVVTVVPTANPSSLPALQLDGSGGPINLPSNLSFTTSYDGLLGNLPITGTGAIINLAGNNTISGDFSLTSGGGGTTFLTNSGNLTLAGGISAVAGAGSGRTVYLRGDGNGDITGPLFNGNFTVSVVRDAGSGIWTLSGANSYSGTTAVNTGTLRLNYAGIDDSKLSDTDALILGGGTVDLAGGTHGELVSTTTLASRPSRIIRSSGAGFINLNNVTPAGGSLLLEAGDVATTDNINRNGILPWARFGNMWGTNSSDFPDAFITPYSGPLTDVARLGASSIPDDFTGNVRIINGGTSGSITLQAARTAVNSLLVDASAGPAVIDPTLGDIFVLGDDAGGTLWQTATSGALTIGTAPDDGVLTSGNNESTGPVTLTVLTDSLTNPATINSAVINNGTEAVSVMKGGAGTLVLNGSNNFTGALTANGGLTILTGNNAARPASASNQSVISAGATLQLQANAGNTSGGFSSALSTERTFGAPLLLGNNSTLQLRSDEAVTFTGGNAMGGWNNIISTLDVNQLTAGGSNNTLTIAPLTIPFGNFVTLNITGGNGYSLAMGTVQNVINAAGNFTLNPTTASVSLAGFNQQFGAANTAAVTLNLSGTSAGNSITGAVANQSASSLATGAVTVNKTGSSTWELQGDNTYTGATTVASGTLTLSGNRTVNSATVTVGNTANTAAVLNVSNGTYTMGTFTVGSGDSTVTGTVNQNGGALTMSGNQLLLGNNGGGFAAGTNATGVYNLSGGTLTTAASTLGVVLGVNHGTTGRFNLSGSGVLNIPATSTLQITRSDNSAANNATGVFIQTGGTATVGILQMGGSSTSASNNSGANATLTLTGGTFAATTFNQLAGASGSTAAINIGGTADVTLPAFPTVRGAGSTASLTFDGGTLRPAAASAAWISNLTSASIKSGGANLNIETGRDVTIAQNLLTDPVSTGGGLTKSGTGILTLIGASTFTGTTLVSDGALALTGASLASPVNVSGAAVLALSTTAPSSTTGAVSFASGSRIRVTGTPVSPASYTLLTATSFTGTPVLESAIVGYSLVIEGGTQLRLKPSTASGFTSFISNPAFGLAAGDQGATADPDKDGIVNLLEYVLNGNPSQSNTAILPVFDASGSNLVFSFNRLDDSLADTTQIFQYGNDLIGWTDVILPATSGNVGAAVITVTNGSPVDAVSVSVPKPAPGVSGTFFGRLKVTQP